MTDWYKIKVVDWDNLKVISPSELTDLQRDYAKLDEKIEELQERISKYEIMFNRLSDAGIGGGITSYWREKIKEVMK